MVASASGSSKRGGSVIDDLESIRSMTTSRHRVEAVASDPQQSADYTANPMPLYPPPVQDAPTLDEVEQQGWTSITTGVDPGTAGVLAQLMPSTPNREDNATRRASSQAASRHRQEQQQARNATTLQLSDLLHGMGDRKSTGNSNTGSSFAWWEVVEDWNPAPDGNPSYHAVRTTLRNGQIGLLIDPGAHDNLAGETTMRQIESQLGVRCKLKALDMPLNVSGVGKQSQEARTALSLPFGLSSGEDEVTTCSYTAPIIPGSHLPPLLGLKSLSAKRALIDTSGRLLVLPGSGGVELKCSPGTQVHQLELSESGHLILPLLQPPQHERSTTSAVNENQRLDFNVHVRGTRSLSPRREPIRRVQGPYQRIDDVIRTGIASVAANPAPVRLSNKSPHS